METKIELAYLYDFYGELLNEHQRQIYEDFVLNDLSSSIDAVVNIASMCNSTLRFSISNFSYSVLYICKSELVSSVELIIVLSFL